MRSPPSGGTPFAMRGGEGSRQMLRITEHREPDRVVLKLEGRLSGAWVAELESSWRAAARAADRSGLWLDLTDVWLADPAGQSLLERMHREGVRFVARGCVMRELVREISEL
jgi:hypothetical protein